MEMERQIKGKTVCAPRMVAFFVAITIAAVAHGSTNVFNDAVFWFRGGKDCVTADGKLQTGEFLDDLHANDAEHANHQMTVSGYAENGAFRTEPVVFPALGSSVVKNMRVLHISDNGRATEGSAVTNRFPMLVTPYSLFAANHISNEYTIVSRVRLDTLSRPEFLFRIGYRTVSGVSEGLLLGFKENTSKSGCKDVYAFRSPRSGVAFSEVSSFYSKLFVPTNTWVDIGVVVGHGKLRVGIAVPSSLGGPQNPTIAFAEDTMCTENCTLNTEKSYKLFGQTPESGEKPDARQDGFIGSVQQVAIWSRALSDQEVMEAFGMPRPAIFRTGFDNGASDEFGGTRSGASQTIDGLGSWQGVSDTMLAGDVWTVNFDALRDEAGLPQIFSIRSLPSSSAAQIGVTLNGTTIGTRTVSSDARVFWPVTAGLLVSGVNTLSVRRVDGDSGVFRMDAMELGGSIGVGIADNNNASDGTVAPKLINLGVPSAADQNPQHWSRHLQSYDGKTNVHFRVWIDQDVRKTCASCFRLRTICANRGASYVIAGNEFFSVFVNSVEKATRDSSTKWTTLDLNFAAGELNEGWNDVELISAPWETCYWMIDFYRFETILRKGFSIPPLGIIVIVE